MNIDDASTEPYYQFFRRIEEFSRTIRIAVAGLVYVTEQQKTVIGPVKLPTGGEPFGHNLFNQPGKNVPAAKRLLAEMGVVHIVTVMEDFCVGVQAEHDRFAGIKEQPVEPLEDVGMDGLSPKALYTRLQFRKVAFNSVEPLYDYFVKVRNCIVHRSGRVSKDLNKYMSNARLHTCIEGWHGPGGKKLPVLPAVELDSALALLPRHAVMAGEVCRRIAIDANAQLRDFLGENGLAYMAAFHSLLSEKPIKTGARNSAEAILNYVVTNRYGIGIANSHEAVSLLARMGYWKNCLRKYERLKADGFLV